jgi:hypothetical protein
VFGCEILLQENIENSISLVNFMPNKQKQMIEETQTDTTLQTLKKYIMEGWPNFIKELPESIRSFWSLRD